MLRKRCYLAHALIFFFFFFLNPTKKRSLHFIWCTLHQVAKQRESHKRWKRRKLGQYTHPWVKRVSPMSHALIAWLMQFLTLTTESHISCGIIWRRHITPRCLTRNTLRKGIFFPLTPVSLIRYLNLMGSN